MKTLFNLSSTRPSRCPVRRPGESGDRAWRSDVQPTPELRQAALRFKLRRLEVALEVRNGVPQNDSPRPVRGMEPAATPRVEDCYEDAERWDGLS